MDRKSEREIERECVRERESREQESQKRDSGKILAQSILSSCYLINERK